MLVSCGDDGRVFFVRARDLTVIGFRASPFESGTCVCRMREGRVWYRKIENIFKNSLAMIWHSQKISVGL